MTDKSQLKEKDFIEIDFTGKTKEGKVFDSTLNDELEKLHESNQGHKPEAKPFIFSLGQGMFLSSLDEFLIGKEVGKEYTIELEPEKAFGKRETSLLQRIPVKVFKEQKLNPYPGAVFNFDGKIGRVITVSGGRILVDFNSPLAGKSVVYNLKVLRKIEDINEKIKALNEFFFRKNIEFEVKGNNVIFKGDQNFSKILDLFKEKFKEILGLDVQMEEKQTKEK